MTGLWQVSGKNRLTFKEMIRLDIQYYRNLSFLSDIKIIFMTPFAIFSELMANRQEENVIES
jgi:lipopolysaccharide/colanic/teichoic acid biosynthesis glycosyltransferase